MKNGRNQEGYSDPTASIAIGQVKKEETAIDRRVYDLVKVLKYIIRSAGFELIGHIRLKDARTGKEYQ